MVSEVLINLSWRQKIAAILLILAKISGIACVPLIFAGMMSEGYLLIAKILVCMAIIFILSCVVLCFFDMKETNESKIEKLLSDPEIYKLLQKRIIHEK